MKTSKIKATKISRYYLSAYRRAESGTKLDSRLWASLDEQRAYFRRRVNEARRALLANLRDLRASYTEAARREKDVEQLATIKSQIEAIDREIAEIRK